MYNKDETYEYIFQAQPIVDIANERLKYMYGSPKGGYISQESRNKSRKKNRKKRK